jgi:hypothetical protein
MFVLNNITKVKEGLYKVQSKSCPECSAAPITVELDSQYLFRYHQGALIQEVLPQLDRDARERFASGYCTPCWSALFAYGE